MTTGRYTYGEVAELGSRRRPVRSPRSACSPSSASRSCMLDTVDFVAMFLGAIALGAVPVPLNTLLTADDYRYLIARQSRARGRDRERSRCCRSSPARCTIARGERWLAPQVATATPRTRRATTPDDVAFWLYSSGSTGKPKGAMHLHAHARSQTAALYAQPILGIRERRRRVLGGEAVLRVRARQLADVSALGRCDARCCAPSGRRPRP